MIVAEPGDDYRQRFGRAGEAAAESALQRAGLRILARRFRRCGAELDLVAEDGETIVFVEVKARRLEGYGAPSEAITPIKRARLARAALAFLQLRGWLERPCRFDVVELLGRQDEELRVRHHVDAFRLWPTG